MFFLQLEPAAKVLDLAGRPQANKADVCPTRVELLLEHPLSLAAVLGYRPVHERVRAPDLEVMPEVFVVGAPQQFSVAKSTV